MDKRTSYQAILRESQSLYNAAKRCGEEHSLEECINTLVLAPSLMAFTLWVIEEAKRKRNKHLYFLARDGYHMYYIAKRLIEQMGDSITCHYLYCSRYSLRSATYDRDIKETLSYICRNAQVVTRRILLKRAGLTKEEIASVMRALNEEGIQDENLTVTELEEVKHRLSTCQEFREAVSHNAIKKRPALMGYLEQEGFFNQQERLGIVDSGWTGTMQKKLTMLRDIKGVKTPIDGYYWGLYQTPRSMDTRTYNTYQFAKKGSRREKIYFSNSLFEALVMAPHGMCTGYKKEGGLYVPILSAIEERTKEFCTEVRQDIKRYTNRFLEGYGNYDKQEEKVNRKVVMRLMKEFMSAPSLEEASTYGSLLFTDDILDDEKKRVIARDLTKQEIKESQLLHKLAITLGLKRGKVEEQAWQEGSIVLNGSNTKANLRRYRRFKYFRYVKMERSGT